MKYLIAALLMLPLAGCKVIAAALGGQEAVEDLATMPEPEWIAWRTEAVAEVKVAAGLALEEEAISKSDLEKAASILTVMGMGNLVEQGQLAKWLGATGYKAALIELAIIKLDSKMAAGGLYVDGLLVERGKDLLVYLGAALQELAVE